MRMKIGLQTCRSSLGPSKPLFHLKLWSCLSTSVVFQGKKDNKAINDNKKHEEDECSFGKAHRSKHWRRQSLVWRCPHNLEALREKGEFLDTETVQRVVRYHRLAEPRDEEYDQDLHEQKNGYQQGQKCMARSCECATCPEADVIAVAATQQVYWGSLLVLSLVFVAACLRPQVCLRDCWPTNAPVTDFWMIAPTWTHLYATSFWTVF